MRMHSQPFSVPEAIREVLANNRIYLQALELGITNFTALAERIKPDIEKLIGTKVNLNTIVVAIKRFADALEEKPESKRPSTMTSRAKMSLTDSIIDLDFQKDRDDVLADILDEFLENDNQYSLFQTENHLRLLTEDADEIRNLVAEASEKFEGKIREGLSKISIVISPDEQSPYYLLSLISNILYKHQIPIQSAFFTPTEMVVVVNDKDGAKAYDLVRMEIA